MHQNEFAMDMELQKVVESIRTHQHIPRDSVHEHILFHSKPFLEAVVRSVDQTLIFWCNVQLVGENSAISVIQLFIQKWYFTKETFVTGLLKQH